MLSVNYKQIRKLDEFNQSEGTLDTTSYTGLAIFTTATEPQKVYFYFCDKEDNLTYIEELSGKNSAKVHKHIQQSPLGYTFSFESPSLSGEHYQRFFVNINKNKAIHLFGFPKSESEQIPEPKSSLLHFYKRGNLEWICFYDPMDNLTYRDQFEIDDREMVSKEIQSTDGTKKVRFCRTKIGSYVFDGIETIDKSTNETIYNSIHLVITNSENGKITEINTLQGLRDFYDSIEKMDKTPENEQIKNNTAFYLDSFQEKFDESCNTARAVLEMKNHSVEVIQPGLLMATSLTGNVQYYIERPENDLNHIDGELVKSYDNYLIFKDGNLVTIYDISKGEILESGLKAIYDSTRVFYKDETLVIIDNVGKCHILNVDAFGEGPQYPEKEGVRIWIHQFGERRITVLYKDQEPLYAISYEGEYLKGDDFKTIDEELKKIEGNEYDNNLLTAHATLDKIISLFDPSFIEKGECNPKTEKERNKIKRNCRIKDISRRILQARKIIDNLLVELRTLLNENRQDNNSKNGTER